MANKRLGNATFVKYGYGQVEPNHLAFRRTGKIYAQLPANKDIELLENGQFAKYDYEAGEVNFTGKGDWLMVFNEVKIYRDRETDADFAMIKQAYNGRVYSPIGQNTSDLKAVLDFSEEAFVEGSDEGYVANIGTYNYPQNMPEGTKMVPRLVKIDTGDLYTTNCVKEESLAVGDTLMVGADGYLVKDGGDENGPKFLVVKVYTMPDNQPGVKLQCIA